MKRRSLSIVLVATLLAAALAVLAFSRLGNTWLSRALIDEINPRLPGELRLDGGAEWQLFPPAIRLSGVHWRPPAGMPGGLDIDEISVRSDWSGDGARPVHVSVTGLRAVLHQGADGQWMVPAPPAANGAGEPAVAFTLASVNAHGIHVTLHPLGRPAVSVQLADFALVAEPDGTMTVGGDWQLAAAAATLAGRVDGRYRVAAAGVDFAPLSVRLNGAIGALTLSDAGVDAAHLHVGDDGALAGDTLTVHARGAFAGTPVDAAATVPTLAFARGRLDASLASVSLRRGAPAPSEVHLDTATLVFDGASVALAPLRGGASLTAPGGPVTLAFSAGTARYAVADARLEFTLPTLAAQLPDPADTARRLDVSADVAGELMTVHGTGAGRLALQAGGATVDGRWWVARDQAQWLGGTLRVDRLDLDRWLPKSPATAGQPAPLDAWRDLPLQLDVRVGRLRWQGVTVRDARLRLNAPADSAPR